MTRQRTKAGLAAAALAAAALLTVPVPSPARNAGTPASLPSTEATTVIRPIRDAAAPVGPSSGAGVQPGGVVRSDVGLCTLNFLFHGADGHRYIGTAGHCILGSDRLPTRNKGAGEGTEKTWAPGSGAVAKDALGHRLGEFAYAVLAEPKDFALIRLDDTVKASPEVATFGGPTGTNADQSRTPVILEYYGNGVGLGTTVPARSALAFGLPDPDHVYAVGVAVPGDSGSAVISADGRAIGVLVTVGAHGIGLDQGGIDTGDIGITRLGPQLARAEEILGLHLDLATAPLT